MFSEFMILEIPKIISSIKHELTNTKNIGVTLNP